MLLYKKLLLMTFGTTLVILRNYFIIIEFKAILNKLYLHNTLRTPSLCSPFFENRKNDEYVINT